MLKKKIIAPLKEKSEINYGQHSFLPGRSIQTQFLRNYTGIYEALTEGERFDIVFLDFSKVFEKVDHSLLLEKLNKHDIGGKIGR